MNHLHENTLRLVEAQLEALQQELNDGKSRDCLSIQRKLKLL